MKAYARQLTAAFLSCSLIANSLMLAVRPVQAADPQVPLSGTQVQQKTIKTFDFSGPDLAQQSFVNLSSGAATANIPLSLPEGLRGLTPNLSLNYSSQLVKQNGPFGFGWNVAFGHIKRMNKRGVGSLYSNPVYQISLEGLQGELVKIGTNGSVDEYRPRREQSFTRVLHFTSEERWEVHTTDGMIYHLGTTDESRWQDDTGQQVYAWYVETLSNAQGQPISYEYRRHQQALYPQRIRYGGTSVGNHPFEVRFLPIDETPLPDSNRSDQRLQYMTGFPVRWDLSVTEIQVLVEGQQRLSYLLEYERNPVLSRTQLSKVTTKGLLNGNSLEQTVELSYYNPWASGSERSYHRAHLLKQMAFHTGGKVLLDYVPSTQLFEGRRRSNLHPHYPLFAVSSVTRSDFTGRNDMTNYHYSDGYFFFESVNERELAGFGKVTITDPLDQKRVHYFHQGGGFDGRSLGELVDDQYLIGQQYRVEQFDASGKMVSREITHWVSEAMSAPSDGRRHFIRPEKSVSTLFTNTGVERSSANTTVYDSTTGNVVEQISHGEVQALADGTFNDVGNDDRRSTVEYALNASKHLLNFPSVQRSFDENDVLISESSVRYDDLPLGQVTLGNATHQTVRHLDENRDITSTTTYNVHGQPTSVVDPLGNTTTITYDSLNLYPASITNALGHETTMEYDLMTSQVTRSVDPNGLEARSALDALGRVIEQKLSDPNQGGSLVTMQTIQYEESSFPHSTITKAHLSGDGNPNGADEDSAEAISYVDGFGRVLQTRTEDAGAADQYIVSNTMYDALDRAIEQTVPVFASGSAYNLSQGSSIKTTTTYDALNRPLSITDANGTSTFSYQLWDRTVTDPLGNSKSFESDAYGRLITVIERESGNEYSTTYNYDSRDLLTKITDANGNVRNFAYDSLGRLTSQEDLHAANDSEFGSRTYTYDDLGNVKTQTDATNQVITFTYDALSRMTERSSAQNPSVQATFVFDQGAGQKGRLSSVTTASSSWTGVYDLRGRLTSETQTVDGTGYSKSYTYTRFDQVKSVTYPNGEVVNRTYNTLGQLDQMTAAGQQVVSELVYAPTSQLEEIRYGNGITSSFEYDINQMYRMVKKQTMPAVPATSWWPSFGDWIPQASAQAIDPGFVPDVEVFDDTQDYGFQMLRMQQENRGSGRANAKRFKSPTRDDQGEVKKPLVEHSGDDQGEKSGIGDLIYLQAKYENTMRLAQSATHYRVQMVSEAGESLFDSGEVALDPLLSAGDSTPMVVIDTRSWEKRVAKIQAKILFKLANGDMTPWSDIQELELAMSPTRPDLTTLQDLRYAYDAAGNITQLKGISESPANRTVDYLYDDLYRLTSTSYSDLPNSATVPTRSYSYDPIGNIVTKSDQGSYTYSQTGKTNPQAVTSLSDGQGNSKAFSYDDNGNLTNQTTTTASGTNTKVLSWDAQHRVSQIVSTDEESEVTTSTFLYDAGVRRLKKVVTNPEGSKTTLYPFADYEITSDNESKISLAAASMQVGVLVTNLGDNTSTLRYHHSDHLGGASIVSDATGRYVQTLDYYPFGETRIDEQYENYDSTQKFTGHEFDASSELYYAQARYYDPAVGRFISEDPLQWKSGNQPGNTPRITNTYAYSLNNPLRFHDPTGESPVEGNITLVGRQLHTVVNTWYLNPLKNITTHEFIKIQYSNETNVTFSGGEYDNKLYTGVNLKMDNNETTEDMILYRYPISDPLNRSLSEIEQDLRKTTEEISEKRSYSRLGVCGKWVRGCNSNNVPTTLIEHNNLSVERDQRSQGIFRNLFGTRSIPESDFRNSTQSEISSGNASSGESAPKKRSFSIRSIFGNLSLGSFRTKHQSE